MLTADEPRWLGSCGAEFDARCGAVRCGAVRRAGARCSSASWARRITSSRCSRRSVVVQGMTYPYGAHFAQGEVDPDAGIVRMLRYTVTSEIGRAVNFMLVRGHLVGAPSRASAGRCSRRSATTRTVGPTTCSSTTTSCRGPWGLRPWGFRPWGAPLRGRTGARQSARRTRRPTAPRRRRCSAPSSAACAGRAGLPSRSGDGPPAAGAQGTAPRRPPDAVTSTAGFRPRAGG